MSKTPRERETEKVAFHNYVYYSSCEGKTSGDDNRRSEHLRNWTK